MENPIECMKQACTRMESHVSTVAGYMATTLGYKTAAESAKYSANAAASTASAAKTAAESAATRAEAAVPDPNGVTYTQAQIDTFFDEKCAGLAVSILQNAEYNGYYNIRK